MSLGKKAVCNVRNELDPTRALFRGKVLSSNLNNFKIIQGEREKKNLKWKIIFQSVFPMGWFVST